MEYESPWLYNHQDNFTHQNFFTFSRYVLFKKHFLPSVSASLITSNRAWACCFRAGHGVVVGPWGWTTETVPLTPLLLPTNSFPELLICSFPINASISSFTRNLAVATVFSPLEFLLITFFYFQRKTQILFMCLGACFSCWIFSRVFFLFLFLSSEWQMLVELGSGVWALFFVTIGNPFQFADLFSWPKLKATKIPPYPSPA